MRPVVSVCIANYNGFGLVDACIKSVQAQDCDFPLEIIVHDDASTDGSAEHIRTYHPGVRLIESAENVGFCIANNRMAAAAHGDFLLLLNNDAELFPDALRTLHGEAIALGHPAIIGLPQYDHETGVLIDIGSMFDPFLNPVPNLDAKRHKVGMVIGACLWIPKPLWVELGGFPDWFDSLAEDMYLCCCARLSGHPVMVLNRSGFRHRVGASLGGGKVTSEKRLATSFKRRSLSERNKTYVMIIAYPGLLLSTLLPFHFLALAIEGILLSLIKRDYRLWQEIYAHCFRSVWRESSHLASVRSSVQAHRKIGLSLWLSVFTFLPHKLRLLMRYGLPEVKR